MGKYFDNYQKSMKVLKTTKANIMLPGEPPLDDKSHFSRTSPLNQTSGADMSINMVTLSTPRLLNRTEPVVVPGIASDELGAHRVSVQSTARFSEMLDYSCSVRPNTSAAGAYPVGEGGQANKQSSASLFGGDNRRFETKFSKLARQSASKFYKQKQAKPLYTQLSQKQQDLSVNGPQRVMLNFSNVQDLKEFFASPAEYLQKKKRPSTSSHRVWKYKGPEIQKIAQESELPCNLVHEPDSGKQSRPPTGSVRKVRNSFHIPLPRHTGGNLTNQFSGSSFQPFWISSDVQNLRQERRGSSRTLLNKKKRGTLSGVPLQLQGLLSQAQFSPNSQEQVSKQKHPKRAQSLALARGIPQRTPKPHTQHSNSSLPLDKSDTVLPQEHQLVFSFHSELKVKDPKSPETQFFTSPRMKELGQSSKQRPSSELASKDFKKQMLAGITSPLSDSFSPRSSSVSGVAPSRVTAFAKTQRMEPIPIKDGSEFFSPRQKKDGRRDTRITEISGANQQRSSFFGRGKTASELNRNDSSSTSDFPHLIQRRYETHRKLLQELESPENLSSGRTYNMASNVSLIVGQGFLDSGDAGFITNSKGKTQGKLEEVLIPVLNKTLERPHNPVAPPPKTAPQSRMSRGTNAIRPQSTKRPPPVQGLKVMLMFSGDVRNSMSSGTGLTGVESIKSIGHQMQLERPQPRSVSKMSYFRAVRSQRFKMITQSRSVTPASIAPPILPEQENLEDEKKLLVSPKPDIISQPESPTPQPPKKRNPRLNKSSELKHLQQLQSSKDKKRKEVQAERKIKENLFTTQQNEQGQVTLTAAPRLKSKPRISYLSKKNSDLDFEQFPLYPYKHRMNSERKLEEASNFSSLKKEKTTAYTKKERKFGDFFSLEKYERDVTRKPII